MSTFDTIRTQTWAISIPTDWMEGRESKNGEWYFESQDGEKGLYIATWHLGDKETSNSAEVAESFKRVDLKTLREMADYSWSIIADRIEEIDGVSVATTDAFDQANSYRIVGKILSRPPVVVRASFHDYRCEDYAVSASYFGPIIGSLAFNQAEA
jgi:hypothetical protein